MTDGIAGTHILDTLGRDGLGTRIIRGRETAETLTCLSLAILWDDPERNMTDETETEYDDDYVKEAHLDRKAREGWTHCEECGDSIHLDDVREGASCSCDDDGKAHPMSEHMRVLGEILANKARKSDE